MPEVQETSQDPELQVLREEWRDFKIWRARRRDDQPGGLATGESLATCPRDEAGAERTIMRPTAQELDVALRQRTRG